MKKLLLIGFLFSALSTQAEILKRSNFGEPKSIDPQLASESAGSAIIFDIFEGLTTYDHSGKIVGGMAESWEISADGKQYVFKLKPNLKWSDGSALTAKDFVYAWQRAVNPETGSEYSWILYPVKNAKAINQGEIKDFSQLGIKALDDLTLQIDLEQATPYFLELTAYYTTYPVPQKIVEQFGKNWTRPEHIVSNGAFKLINWQPNSLLEVVKSDYYWDKANIKLDGVKFYTTEDESNSFKRYRSNEVDIAIIPTEQLEWAKNNLANEVKINPFLATYWYGFNLNDPLFKDNLKLRQALTIAIDRQAMVDKITKAGQTPAYSVTPPLTNEVVPYLPEYAQLNRNEQIELAKKLYGEAGYSKENPLKLTITYNTNEGHKKIAIAIAAMWKDILGAEVELINQEWVALLSNLSQGKMQVYRYAWIGDYNDPYTFLEIFRAKSDMNYSKFNSPEFDQKLDEANLILDMKERAKKLNEAEALLTNHYAVAPIYHYVKVSVVKPYVKGYQPNIMGNIFSKHLSIEK